MSETENKKKYELSYFLSPETPEDKIDSEAAELGRMISENGGEDVQLNPLEQRRLAYPIKKQDRALFGWALFSADPDSLDKIKNVLSSNKKLLRFLVVADYSKLTPYKIESPKLPGLETSNQPQSFDQKLENILKG